MNGVIRRRVMQNKTEALPEALVECEYIEKTTYNSVAGPYIDTGIKATSDLRIVIKIQNAAPNDSNKYPAVFGIRGNNDFPRFECFSTSDIVQCFMISGVKFTIQNYMSTSATPHVIDLSIDRLIYDGVTHLPTDSGADKNWTSNLTLYVGSLHHYSQPGVSSVAYKLYYCKVYNKNELVRDYIPVYNLNSREYGLYDAVNKVFITTSNNYPFAGKIKQ